MIKIDISYSLAVCARDQITESDVYEAYKYMFTEQIAQNAIDYHHEDDWHYGESIAQHTADVFNSIENIVKTWKVKCCDINNSDIDKIILLKQCALLHDVGKCSARQWNDKKKRHQFKGHPEESYNLCKNYLPEGIPNREIILLLVRHHDDLQHLYSAKMSNVNVTIENKYKYLDKFIKKPISYKPLFNYLLILSMADSCLLPRHKEMLDMKLAVSDDTMSARMKSQYEKNREMKVQMMVEENISLKSDIVIKILSNSYPQAICYYPDIKAINRELGKAGMFNVIKEIKSVLESDFS